MKLSFLHSVILVDRKTKARSEQQLEICVDYDPETDGIDDVDVYVYENGKRLCEISLLLDKAEGDPLPDMLAAIDWHELYQDKRHEMRFNRYEY